MLKLNYGCFLSTNWCYMLLLNIPLISDKTKDPKFNVIYTWVQINKFNQTTKIKLYYNKEMTKLNVKQNCNL